jgi:hypothetical protein
MGLLAFSEVEQLLPPGGPPSVWLAIDRRGSFKEVSFWYTGLGRVLTFKAVEHLSAAWLLIARPLRAAFPSITSARISSDPGLSKFSSTK